MRSGKNAHKNMCSERAKIWIEEVLEMVESVKKTLDSKSGESMADHNNKQATLIDKVNKTTSERVLNVKENASRSIWDSIMHKEKDEMSDK